MKRGAYNTFNVMMLSIAAILAFLGWFLENGTATIFSIFFSLGMAIFNFTVKVEDE